MRSTLTATYPNGTVATFVRSKTKRDAEFAYCEGCAKAVDANVFWGWRKSAHLHETHSKVTYWRAE